MLRRNVGGFVRRRDDAVGGRDIDDAPPTAALHVRQRLANRMEVGGEVDRDDRIPAIGRKIFDRRDVLDARVIDQNVDTAEGSRGLGDEKRDFRGLRNVRRAKPNGRAAFFGETGARSLDLRRVAESVEHDVGTAGRKRSSDTESDAACGSRNECSPSSKHRPS